FLNDPQFPDGIVVEEHPRFLGFLDFAGRAEEAYLSLQWPYVDLEVGRTYRNWGLPGTGGLLVSNYAYSYDQLAYRVGTDRVALTGFVAQLDEFPGSVKRWLSAHRVDWRIRENLSVALAEAVTYGGENRSFDFRLSNPLNLWLVGGFGEDFVEGPNTSNNLTEIALWWRPARGLVTYLSFVGDEFPGGGTPLEHAAALGLQLPRLGDRLALRLDYSQVATLTYRTTRDHERYAFRDIGLGRDLSDHDLTALRLDWLPRPHLVLSPQLHLLRRGEGDFRQPWPSGQVSEDGPVLFSGEVETTLRVALGGRWRPARAGVVEWDAGGNFIWDAGHVEGRDVTRFAGRLRVSLETR
ncbi:MAG: capsule assembly Wzi family protein, partial [Gemmatimonadota bacterium]